MFTIYEWLFDQYALPQLEKIRSEHSEALTAYTDRVKLSQLERLRLHDMVSNMRLDWGAAAFTLGVKFGQQLHDSCTRSEEPGWLMHFLP